jgi:hypothetical protein
MAAVAAAMAVCARNVAVIAVEKSRFLSQLQRCDYRFNG